MRNLKLGLEGCDIRDNGEENIREIMEGVKGIKNLQVLGLDLGEMIWRVIV